MDKPVNIDESAGSEFFNPKISISDAHEEFSATKKTVTDLLNYKRSLIDIDNSDFDKINEIKGKAIDAINNLFNDIINTK